MNLRIFSIMAASLASLKKKKRQLYNSRSPERVAYLKEKAEEKRERKAAIRSFNYAKCLINNPCLRK